MENIFVFSCFSAKKDYICILKINNMQNNHAINFLERNNFTKVKENTYFNDKCTVVIYEDYYEVEYYEEAVFDYVFFYTDSLSLPNLLGKLLWMELIDRDFSK